MLQYIFCEIISGKVPTLICNRTKIFSVPLYLLFIGSSFASAVAVAQMGQNLDIDNGKRIEIIDLK